jgi:hypothetical protein
MREALESFGAGRPTKATSVVPILLFGAWYNPPPFGKQLFVSRFQEPSIAQHGGALIIF